MSLGYIRIWRCVLRIIIKKPLKKRICSVKIVVPRSIFLELSLKMIVRLNLDNCLCKI